MRFGRKSGSAANESAQTAEASEAEARIGPFDASEVNLDELDCVDLGSMLIALVRPMELQLQVEEETGQVMAAILVGEEGALELRAFAASRGGGAWDELRPQISSEIARLGGTADEQQGSFGTELLCMVPVQAPDGRAAAEPNRIVAHEGPAWLLRATLMGPPALKSDLAAPYEETIRQVVVRRGREAMPPGAPLPLILPPEARRVDPAPVE